MPYEKTSVSIESSQGAIRKLLTGYGATRFSFHHGLADDGGMWAALEFVHGGHLVRMQVPLKMPPESEVTALARRRRISPEVARPAAAEQEGKRIWRVLHWSLKARLEAVAEKVETFEEAFLAHLVDPSTGGTLWQVVQPAIEAGHFQIGGKGLAALGPGERGGE